MKEVLVDGRRADRAPPRLPTRSSRPSPSSTTLPGLYVVKTDGLAAGKGVLVTESLAEAEADVRAKLSGAAFGDAGRTVVIEEGLTGPELSVLCLCDGAAGRRRWRRPRTSSGSATATRPEHRRHGRLLAGARPSTPPRASGLAEALVAPTLAALRRRGIDYRGVLYAGLMLTPDGPKVLEYNVRFGDPEAQVVLPRLDLRPGRRCWPRRPRARCEAGRRFGDDAAVTVVCARRGLPGRAADR